MAEIGKPLRIIEVQPLSVPEREPLPERRQPSEPSEPDTEPTPEREPSEPEKVPA